MQDNSHSTGEANIKKLAELIRDVKIAMFTTVDPDGCLRSRPMATQKTEFNGELWFFTARQSGKIQSVNNDQHVNVAYAHPDDQLYVSVSGRAELVEDQRKIDELWTPALRAWFPKGKDDPSIALLRVKVESAEYWDSPSSALVHLVGFATALLKGEHSQPGENERMDIANPPVH